MVWKFLEQTRWEDQVREAAGGDSPRHRSPGGSFRASDTPSAASRSACPLSPLAMSCSIFSRFEGTGWQCLRLPASDRPDDKRRFCPWKGSVPRQGSLSGTQPLPAALCASGPRLLVTFWGKTSQARPERTRVSEESSRQEPGRPAGPARGRGRRRAVRRDREGRRCQFRTRSGPPTPDRPCSQSQEAAETVQPASRRGTRGQLWVPGHPCG